MYRCFAKLAVFSHSDNGKRKTEMMKGEVTRKETETTQHKEKALALRRTEYRHNA